MRTGKKIFFAILFLLLVGALFFRPRLEDFFLQSQLKIADFTKTAQNLVTEKIEKNISTPPPLRAVERLQGATLTRAGTIQWTNTDRKDNGGLPALKENPKLDAAALAKAQDMFANQYFEHTSPGGKGPQDLAEQVGYNYLSIGENLALGNFGSDKELLDAWMASPGHRANILNQGYTEIGVAVMPGRFEGQSTWIAVQEFGSPISLCPAIDAGLKDTIDSDNKKISQLSAKLAAARNDINSTETGNADLSQKIKEYNANVKKYNTLVSETKSLIENYNGQVKDFNSCVKKRTQ